MDINNQTRLASFVEAGGFEVLLNTKSKNMYISKTIYGEQYLPIACTTVDFKNLILSEIEQSENHFSSHDLIARISRQCDFQKEPNVTYAGSIGFLGNDLDIINRIIWELIWDKKLMIDFINNRQNHSSEIFYFIKTNV